MDSDNFEYDDKYDNDLRVRASVSELENRKADLNDMLDLLFKEQVYIRETMYTFHDENIKTEEELLMPTQEIKEVVDEYDLMYDWLSKQKIKILIN